MKKIVLSLVLALTLVISLFTPPQESFALTKLEQAEKDLKNAEAKQRQIEQNLKNAESKIRSIRSQKQKTQKDIASIDKNINIKNEHIHSIDDYIYSLDNDIQALAAEINELETEIINTEKEMTALETESKQVETDIEQSKQLLKETIERIDSRNALIEDRLRYMYTTGDVSYLEVLMNSTSFSDFLIRFDTVKSLVDYDTQLLNKNKDDQKTVTLKLIDIEDQLAQLVILYEKQVVVKNNQLAMKDTHTEAKKVIDQLKVKQVAAKNEQTAEKARLVSLAKNKKVQISSLNKQEQELTHYTEEQENAMIEAAALVAASQKTISYYKAGTKFKYPLPKSYRISSYFGVRIDPITGRKGAQHNGMDFAAPAGVSILAAESGRVITAGWVRGYGNTVILDHGDGLWTLYAHARNGGIKVKNGQLVKRGDKISEVGTTGNSTGNHLHFEVRKNQKAIDPRGYLGL